ncbi:cell division protein ZapA [Eisenibacter elegans]|uniref:cell division protein ZapA n=1 Tax=Eisenibacter elegans TaxID=997 RepID=UPI0004169892|nr:cell division protein ZapA [Eisenibacter elegans]
MGEKLSIKIKIAEREYPMRTSVDTEELLRKAGRQLNERIQSYRENYQIEDRQDLLAMVAFDCMVALLGQQTESESTQSLLNQKLQKWDELITSALKLD